MLALAASGARIAAALTLAAWRTALCAEIAVCLPGARGRVVLTAEPPPVAAPHAARLQLPLGVGAQRRGWVEVRLPPDTAPAAQGLLTVLTQFATLRLAQLPDAGPPTHPAAERARARLPRRQAPARGGGTRHHPQFLFDEVVRRAGELTEGETAALLLDDPQGRGLTVQAEWGYPDGPRPRCYLGRGGLAGLVITGGQILMVDHAPSDPRYAAPVVGPPAKSLIGVPVRRAGRVIGALIVSNHSRYFAFRQQHVDLLGMLAHYATIASEVADLLAAGETPHRDLHPLHQALAAIASAVARTAEENRALYAISACIQNTPDLEAALPSVLAMLGELVAAQSGAIFLLPPPLAPPERPGRLVVHWGPKVPPAAGRELIVPLRRGESDLGAILLVRGADQPPFAPSDQATAGEAADQLARAIETRGVPGRDLTALYGAPSGSGSPLDLAQLVIHLAEQIQTLAGSAAAVAILYDSESNDWQTAATVGTPPASWPLPAAGQRALLDQIWRTREGLCHRPAAPADQVLLLLPLLADDHLIGAIALPEMPSAILATKLPFLSALARHAAVHIHNTQLQLHAEELLILEERNRLARAMHDDLAQTLTQIRIHCELVERILRQDPDRATEELARIRAELKQGAAELVRVIGALDVPPLAQQGLAQALQTLGAELTHPGARQVDVVLPDPPADLAPQIELTLFRATQEALRKAVWQCGADYCRVALQITSGAAVLTVQHNGHWGTTSPIRGPAAQAPHRLGMIDERVAELGGALEITTPPGGGTHLVITLPHPARRPGPEGPPREKI